MGEYLPLYIDFHCRKVVIFGGGAVGERKAKYFAPAEVVVVSTSFTECLEAMGRDGLIKLERRAITVMDVEPLIAGAFLVVAATGDRALNDEIAKVAESRGILANNATGAAPVIVPSVLKKGDVTIAIATGGRSPAMARYVRLRLEASLGEDVERMVALQERLRERLKMSVEGQKRREEALRAILEDPDVWEALKVSQDEAFEAAMKHVPAKGTDT
ncbi:MAG TPA: bifunctional precorrin-2 dehydrogenase/sirohydrochlorin ferrochelatase [Methanocella sp.]|nr:bifunctional precorrin-2 dehydrogenase/sirohydrochlorin ferrochelatase [Methanocella sp.]